jgi:nucleotide-binding universal stress UspA family protein
MLVTPSRIVAATDFSDDAANAVRRASLLARRQGIELELLHVVSRSSLDALREWVREPADFAERLVEDTRRILEEAAAATGTPASARLGLGEVHEEISSSCAHGRILVVGARGLNPLRDAIIGTTAERLVGRCECPILVVRKSPRGDYRKVVVAVDLLPGSENALAAALAMAPGAVRTRGRPAAAARASARELSRWRARCSPLGFVRSMPRASGCPPFCGCADLWIP